jgi:hypothetical protein
LKLSVKLVATTLTEVLLRFEHQTKVLAAQAPGAPQLLQRVEYLRARLEDERKLWPQAEASLAGALKSAPPGPIVPLSLMAKTERKLVNLGSDDIKLIHSGKKLMRKAKALEVLKSALPELRANIAGLESDLKDDAALQKAKLELAAATFAVNVHEVAEFIFSAVFVPSPVELNYLNAVAHAWLANPSTSMKQQISEAQTELNDAVASLQADDA